MDKKKGFVRFLCSLKLTITLLILLAVVSIFGTVIPQRLPESEYLKHYSEGLFRFLNLLGIFDLYHAWWFQFLLVLLIANLISCSLERFPKAWRFISNPKKWLVPGEANNYPLNDSFKLQGNRFSLTKIEGVIDALLKHAERTENENMVVLFSEQGRISRLGVYITHLSVIIIILGALIGSAFGFEGFVNLLEGTATNIVYLRDGKNTPKRLDFTVRCDNFDISLYPNGMVKEYTNYLSILKNGKVLIKSQKVEVNHPLMFEGVRFYQASYEKQRSPLMTIGVLERGIVGEMDFRVMGGAVKHLKDGTDFSVVQYHPDLQGFGPAVKIMEKSPGGMSKTFWIFLNYPKFDIKRGGEHIYILKNVGELYLTGLQVTKDPGVWVVWVGCLMMVGGLVITFFISHKRVWAILEKKGKEIGITIVGSTNRNLISFEREFQGLSEGIRAGLRKKLKMKTAKGLV